MSKQYVLVTAISHFRMRYCIPVDELRKENLDATDDQFDPVTRAKDCVTMNEVDEFSQAHISEDIVDTRVVSEEEMLRQFDEDNDYLRSWTTDKKIEFVHRWKSNLT
jgi:hypothetical protein